MMFPPASWIDTRGCVVNGVPSVTVPAGCWVRTSCCGAPIEMVKATLVVVATAPPESVANRV